MWGRLENSLSYNIKVEQKRWRSKNKLRRKFSYNFLRSLLMSASKNALFSASALLFLFSILSLLAFLLPDNYLALVPDNIENLALAGYFSGLWGIQAAIGALVYPIVIAFVTLLLQRRHQSSSLIHIYFHDSAAILSGLSAIFLVLLMAVQYLALGLIDSQIGLLWLYLDGGWFVLNIALTAFFIFRTFEYIKPSRRAETIQRYTVNIALPQEIEENLRSFLFLTAIEQNLIQYSDLQNGTDKNDTAVWLGPFAGGMETPLVEKNIEDRSKLVDVRFRLLGWMVRRWIKRLSSVKENERTYKDNSFLSQTAVQRESLRFPLNPGSFYSGSTVLVGVDGSVFLTFIERWLIRRAFVFKRTRKVLEPRINDILSDLKGDALLYLRDGEVEGFSDAVDDIVELYCILIEGTEQRNSNDEIDSYARVPDRYYVFSAPLYRQWSEKFIDLFEAATDRISYREDFFEDLIYIPLRIFTRTHEIAHTEILIHCMNLLAVLFHRLGGWWVRLLEQQGVLEHDVCKPSSLRPPYYSTYEKLVLSFVGAWESLKNERFPPRRDESPQWEELKAISPLYEKHLHETAEMLFECANRGDKRGVAWMRDVLTKWFAELEFRFRYSSSLFERDDMINFHLLSYEWSDIEKLVDVEEGYLVERAPKMVFSIALRNYWVDVCCTVIYMLVLNGRGCEADDSIPVELLKAIIYGDYASPDAHAIRGGRPVKTAGEALSALLRQYYSHGGYRSGYRASLDHLVSNLTRMLERPMVPGRIYNTSGADDLRSLRDGQIFFLLLLVNERWSPLQSIESVIRLWARESDEKLRDLLRDLSAWMERLSEEGFSEYRDFYNQVRSGSSYIEFAEAKKYLSDGIAGIVERIGEIRSEVVRDTQVSRNRIHEVEKSASQLGFAVESGEFPIPLFEAVDTADTIDIDREWTTSSVTIRRVEKGEFTEPPLAQRAANEEEWLAELVRDRVAASVLAEVIRKLHPKDADASSPEMYWKRMTKYENRISELEKQGLLLIENPTRPDWVYEWTTYYYRRQEGMPPDMEVWKDPNLESSGYICNLNMIGVFDAKIPDGSSILIAKESLKRFEPYPV